MFQNPSPVPHMMEEARSSKDAGNASWQSGDLDAALLSYRAAVASLEGLKDIDASELRRNLFGNISMVLLKSGNAEAAVGAADKAIAEDANWPKGHYRRGAAQLELAVLTAAATANDDSGICARKRAGDAFRKVVTICGLIRLIMFRFGSGS